MSERFTRKKGRLIASAVFVALVFGALGVAALVSGGLVFTVIGFGVALGAVVTGLLRSRYFVDLDRDKGFSVNGKDLIPWDEVSTVTHSSQPLLPLIIRIGSPVFWFWNPKIEIVAVRLKTGGMVFIKQIADPLRLARLIRTRGKSLDEIAKEAPSAKADPVAAGPGKEETAPNNVGNSSLPRG